LAKPVENERRIFGSIENSRVLVRHLLVEYVKEVGTLVAHGLEQDRSLPLIS